MGRPSKLTPKQWDEVGKRHLAGEKMRPLAREFGVTEGAIRSRVTTQTEQIKEVAKQIVEVNKVLADMPIATQIATQTYAQKLMAVANNMHATTIAATGTAKCFAEAAKTDAESKTNDELMGEDVLRTHAIVANVVNLNNKPGVDMMALAVKAGMPTDEEPEEKDITPSLSKVRARIALLNASR